MPRRRMRTASPSILRARVGAEREVVVAGGRTVSGPPAWTHTARALAVSSLTACVVTIGLCIAAAVPVSADASPRAVERLREYLQIDTTNPPGGEAPAARRLAEWLEQAGLEPQLLESPEGRVSVYARARADASTPDADSPAMVLVHHIDVVPAGEGWTVEPFSGRLLDERIWGRGAIDIKSLGIAQLEALDAVLRSGRPLRRDLIYLGVADEEQGGGQGAGWLVDAHPELFAGVEGVLNEGGSNRVFAGRVVWWGVEVVQKRPLWLRLRAEGRGGHGSSYMPASAGHRLLRALGRVLERPPRYRTTPAATLQLAALAGLEGKDPAAAAAHLESLFVDGLPTAPLQPGTEIFFLDSLQVTQVELADAVNVIAAVATAGLDIRLLPDTDADAYLAELRELLGPGIEVEVQLRAPTAEPSPRRGPVWRALERALGTRAPVVPTMLPGTTDSRYFRQRGIPAYGVSPFAIPSSELTGIHAADEAIPREGFLRGVETQRLILEAYALDPPAP